MVGVSTSTSHSSLPNNSKADYLNGFQIWKLLQINSAIEERLLRKVCPPQLERFSVRAPSPAPGVMTRSCRIFLGQHFLYVTHQPLTLMHPGVQNLSCEWTIKLCSPLFVFPVLVITFSSVLLSLCSLSKYCHWFWLHQLLSVIFLGFIPTTASVRTVCSVIPSDRWKILQLIMFPKCQYGWCVPKVLLHNESKTVMMTWFETFLDISYSVVTSLLFHRRGWVFIREWRSCVECSYFGFVEHSENCYEVSPVYCYQQVLVLADISHCFHVASPC